MSKITLTLTSKITLTLLSYYGILSKFLIAVLILCYIKMNSTSHETISSKAEVNSQASNVNIQIIKLNNEISDSREAIERCNSFVSEREEKKRQINKVHMLNNQLAPFIDLEPTGVAMSPDERNLYRILSRENKKEMIKNHDKDNILVARLDLEIEELKGEIDFFTNDITRSEEKLRELRN